MDEYMRCPVCGHEKVIIDYSAPIGGSYFDEEGNEHHRLRCGECGRPIRMSELQPSRPPKPHRDKLET
jgi:transcription elongation factor Elf1